MTTISTQRGVSNIGSLSTLFTNSGSVNATRVITNGVNINNYGYTCGCNLGGDLIVCPSGGLGYHVGTAGYIGCNASVQSIQMLSDQRAIPGSWQATSVPPVPWGYTCCGGIVCCTYGPQPCAGFNNTCGAGSPYLGSAIYNIGGPNPSCLNGGSGYPMTSMVPQFWIGASDAVKFSPRGGSSQQVFCYQGKGGYPYYNTCGTVYVGWSFTLVSE